MVNVWRLGGGEEEGEGGDDSRFFVVGLLSWEEEWDKEDGGIVLKECFKYVSQVK